MTGEETKLQDPIKYEGSRVVVIADNSKLPIAHIGDVVFSPEDSKKDLILQDVYHVPGMKKNLLSVSQIASLGHYVLFGPNDVKIYKQVETSSTPLLQGRRS